jgi:hypothetical protein
VGGDEVDAALNRIAGDDAGTGDRGGKPATGLVLVHLIGIEANGMDRTGERGQHVEIGTRQPMTFAEEAATVALDVLGDDGTKEIMAGYESYWIEDEGIHW